MAHQEIEIKLAVESLPRTARRLRALGARLHRRRTFEDNFLLDYRDGRIRKSGSLLRVRMMGRDAWVTFKGPGRVRRGMKVRREIQAPVQDGTALLSIFEQMGLSSTFRYQKYRTLYRSGSLWITLDETPIGNYVELEGPPRRIEAVAGRLGFARKSYISESYYELFGKYRKGHKKKSKNMTFGDV